MAITDITCFIRPNITKLVPYSSARDEYSGNDAVLMDANENPYNAPFNRYPDPLQRKLKQEISKISGVNTGNLFLGNGSDEAIDLLIRAFCNPGIDNIIVIDPTYGMYEVCANINDVQVIKVLLNKDFSLDPGKVLSSANEHSKIIFLCSPNNPTSNLLKETDILEIIERFNGIVVIDEAYIDFSGSQGLLPLLPDYKNMVILRTFSKAWGLAGIRLGMAMADCGIITVLNKIKYPYNVNNLSQESALKSLKKMKIKEKWVKSVLEERKIMASSLELLEIVQTVYHSDANFLLVRFTDAKSLYDYLRQQKFIVRDRSKVSLCSGCLRITIGTKHENRELIKHIRNFNNKIKNNIQP